MVESLTQQYKQANNEPFVKVKMADKTGSLEVNIWSATLDDAGTCMGMAPGKVHTLSVETNEWKGKISGRLTGWSPATEHNPKDFFKASEYDPEEMWQAFEQYIEDFSSPHFKAVTKDLFDEESISLFKAAPAATGMHHAFMHGLLEHTLQMLQIGDTLLKMPFFQKPLNKDICMFGIMFHDFGKIYEYSTNPGFKKRLQGLLVPHIPMVGGRILESANKLGVPEMVRDHMMHVVLAHHRFKAWGSPVTFAFPEAAFVHYVDNLHGDVFGMLQKREGVKDETVVYGFGDDRTTLLTQSFNDIMKLTEEVKDGF